MQHNKKLSYFGHLQILKSAFSPSQKIFQHALKILNKFHFVSLLFLFFMGTPAHGPRYIYLILKVVR